MGRVIVLAGIFFVPILASAQSCGPQPEGPCIECGPYTNIWTLDYCPSQTNSSSVSPTEICQHYGDVPTIPTVVAPIYQAGQKETHDDYDCKDTVYIYVGISNSVGGVQWDPPLPAHLTNSFCSTAYVNVTSSDTNWCASPGRVDIGSCCWCVSVISTNCIYSGFFTLTNGTISPTNGCLGSAFSASASKITSNAMVVVTTHCPCSTNADINTTNYPAPTIVSNWWVASVGSFTASGNGLSASFTPTNGGSGAVTFYLTYKNSTPCDTNVYSATPVSLSFNVIEIAHQCVATTPTNQDRTTIGVGEQVNLSLVGSPSGTFTWTTSAGSVSPTNGTSTTLTAPGNAATAIITVYYTGGSCTLGFSVIEPSGVNMVTNGLWHYINRPSVGFQASCYIAPDSVNFGVVSCKEETNNFVANGIYSFMNGQPHDSNPGTFPCTSTVVSGLGTLWSADDHVISGDPGTPSPFTPGTEICTIPWDFNVGTNAMKKFTTLTHNCSLGAGGALNASKAGASWSCNVTSPSVNYPGGP